MQLWPTTCISWRLLHVGMISTTLHIQQQLKSSQYLQLCHCTWAPHTEPACSGLCEMDRGTWQKESGTCRCWNLQPDRCWSHQSSTQAALWGHSGGDDMFNQLGCRKSARALGCHLPSMLFGSESSVLVLQRSPSPVPSIQMYMAWTLSPCGRSMYCCFTALLRVALADVAIIKFTTITHLKMGGKRAMRLETPYSDVLIKHVA